MDSEFMELPDHVAVELEFLYLLTFNRNQAARAGQLDAAFTIERLQQRFLGEHLGAWIVPFAAAVAAGAETAFYRELAAFTERFVRMQSIPSTVH
jgi:TorA maturation chaperone TorD